MKKTYLSPNTRIVATAACLPVASSTPDVTLNAGSSVDAAEIDVKASRTDYNVWDDDWSK